MKRLTILSISLVFLWAATAQANQKPANLDAANIAKVLKIIEQNRALFSNPELLQKFVELNKNIKKK